MVKVTVPVGTPVSELGATLAVNVTAFRGSIADRLDGTGRPVLTPKSFTDPPLLSASLRRAVFSTRGRDARLLLRSQVGFSQRASPFGRQDISVHNPGRTRADSTHLSA
jgi:hypothetical protein